MRKICLVAAAVAIVVGGLTPLADAASTPVACNATTLVTAITTANASTGPTTLSLAHGCVYVLTSASSGVDGLPPITDPLTIHGNGATILRNSSADFRILDVGPVTVAIDHLTIEGGHLSRSKIVSNVASLGGGVYNDAGPSVTSSKTKITSNIPTNCEPPGSVPHCSG